MKDNRALIENKLAEVPARLVLQWIERYNIQLTITRKRATKLGDYRHPHGTHGHRISINGNLNPHAFLITFVHEVAHLITWERYKSRVKPHGPEWKDNYSYLLNYLVAMDVFPVELKDKLFRYMRNPAASSCSDIELTRILKAFDEEGADLHLEDLTEGTEFLHRQRAFIKGPKLRKRYKCVEVGTRKVYLFSPVAEVVVQASAAASSSSSSNSSR